MITAFETYLLLQLDTARNVMLGLSILGAMATAMVTLYRHIELRDDERTATAPAFKRLCLGYAVLLAALTVTPSSRTVAAMIVLPAITSDKAIETVAPEAREVYDLAKQALRQLAAEPQCKDK